MWASGRRVTGSFPHVFLCDVPDVIHIFDVALMLNGANGNGLFTHFRGHVFLHFEAQFFEDQVPYGVGGLSRGRENESGLSCPGPIISVIVWKPSSELRPETLKIMAVLKGTCANSNETGLPRPSAVSTGSYVIKVTGA